MIIDGHCNDCGNDFDAHWGCYPDLTTQEAILKPYCPKCKGIQVTTVIDERGDKHHFVHEAKNTKIKSEVN